MQQRPRPPVMQNHLVGATARSPNGDFGRNNLLERPLCKIMIPNKAFFLSRSLSLSRTVQVYLHPLLSHECTKGPSHDPHLARVLFKIIIKKTIINSSLNSSHDPISVSRNICATILMLVHGTVSCQSVSFSFFLFV